MVFILVQRFDTWSAKPHCFFIIITLRLVRVIVILSSMHATIRFQGTLTASYAAHRSLLANALLNLAVH